MFIPNQDDNGSDVSDWNCNNDPYGCWTPSHAVVDRNWAKKVWPNNIPADYAFLVVSNVGSHQGPTHVNDALERAVPAFDISFRKPDLGRLTYGLGYPGKQDTDYNPADFRYCRQSLDDEPDRSGYMLDDCGLTAGASGGP